MTTCVGVSLALAAILSVGAASPMNSTTLLPRQTSGHCESVYQNSRERPGAFVPQCDARGNFMPQQCSSATGYCWCVNIITGEEVVNTRTPPGRLPTDCSVLSVRGWDFYCPYDWFYYEKRCFIFINSPKNWVEAENYCLFEGANLASIHSYEENHFVQSLTRGDAHDFPESWIGGFDAVLKDFWMWADGTKFYYENFFTDFNVDRSERCLKMNYGYAHHWNFASCKDSLPFVCVKAI